MNKPLGKIYLKSLSKNLLRKIINIRSSISTLFEDESKDIINLHKDFNVYKNPRCHNRSYDALDGKIEIKTRVGFDEVDLLNNCGFLGKIGNNNDPQINYKYVGFFYSSLENKDQLIKYSKIFPYAELIDSLDNNGVITNESEISLLQ